MSDGQIENVEKPLPLPNDIVRRGFPLDDMVTCVCGNEFRADTVDAAKLKFEKHYLTEANKPRPRRTHYLVG